MLHLCLKKLPFLLHRNFLTCRKKKKITYFHASLQLYIFFLNTSNRIKTLIIFYLEKIDEQKYLISKKRKKYHFANLGVTKVVGFQVKQNVLMHIIYNTCSKTTFTVKSVDFKCTIYLKIRTWETSEVPQNKILKHNVNISKSTRHFYFFSL